MFRGVVNRIETQNTARQSPQKTVSKKAKKTEKKKRVYNVVFTPDGRTRHVISAVILC